MNIETYLNKINNAYYKLIIGLCENLEKDKIIYGNAHHLAQDLQKDFIIQIKNRLSKKENNEI
jgi:hypothetical protein